MVWDVVKYQFNWFQFSVCFCFLSTQCSTHVPSLFHEVWKILCQNQTSSWGCKPSSQACWSTTREFYSSKTGLLEHSPQKIFLPSGWIQVSLDRCLVELVCGELQSSANWSNFRKTETAFVTFFHKNGHCWRCVLRKIVTHFKLLDSALQQEVYKSSFITFLLVRTNFSSF